MLSNSRTYCNLNNIITPYLNPSIKTATLDKTATPKRLTLRYSLRGAIHNSAINHTFYLGMRLADTSSMNAKGGEEMNYDEALELRKKWVDGATAEQIGFQAARWESTCRKMSGNKYLQERYEQGFADAKWILLQEGNKTKEGA